jgi:PhnB protein
LSGPSEDDAQLRGYWQKLGEGATVVEPLATAPWGASFGMLVDRFGVNWMVNISADAA